MQTLVPITPEQAEKTQEIVLIYGPSTSGKTRLATSLPERWGKIAYIAFDKASESLKSVLSQYRDRISVFRPMGQDPIVEGTEVAVHNWTEDGFNTIILDTFSTWAWEMFRWGTNVGKFQAAAKHKSVGTPGTPGFMALPDKGDYGGAQGVIRNFVAMLFANQPTLNIIFVCHEDRITDDATATIGGPHLPGKALMTTFPRDFQTVIHMDRTMTPRTTPDGKSYTDTKRIARMDAHGVWMARRNESNPKGNALKSMVLDTDPISFWEKYDTTK